MLDSVVTFKAAPGIVDIILLLMTSSERLQRLTFRTEVDLSALPSTRKEQRFPNL